MEKDISTNKMTGIVTGVVTCGKLNVRKRPSLTSDVEDVLAKGTKISVNLDRSTQNYYSVNSDGIEGYCCKEYIKIK